MNFNIKIGQDSLRITDIDILHSDARDFLGRKVFSDITLKVDKKSVRFIDAIIQLTEEFTIVKTAFQGRSGTVKEMISAADYTIIITASVNSENPDIYPRSDMQDLIAILNSGKQIEVISEFLALFDIHYIVPTKYIADQVVAKQSAQTVVMSFLSDKDVQLTIDEEDNKTGSDTVNYE